MLASVATEEAMACPHAQEGGALYTWGGVAMSGGRGTLVRSHHRGCLGLGDTAGRMEPTQCVLLCLW